MVSDNASLKSRDLLLVIFLTITLSYVSFSSHADYEQLRKNRKKVVHR